MPQDLPILSVLIAVPAVTAAVVALLPPTARNAVRGTALAGAVVAFLVSLVVLARFSVGEAGFQLGEAVEWIPQWGITYRLGVDGVSLFLVLLTAFIMPLACSRAGSSRSASRASSVRCWRWRPP
jgi:NADH-quinone oxidoreductase subunit M